MVLYDILIHLTMDKIMIPEMIKWLSGQCPIIVQETLNVIWDVSLTQNIRVLIVIGLIITNRYYLYKYCITEMNDGWIHRGIA